MSKSIRVLVVEDDENTVKYLERIVIEEMDNVDIIGHSGSVAASIELIKKSRPEVILMDIVLNDGISFSILDAFPKPEFEVIFISSYGKYLEMALEYYAFSFLTKPIDSERVVEIFQKYTNLKQRIFNQFKYDLLKEMILEKGQKFLLHVGDKYIAVNFSDIVRCKAEGNYTTFFLSDKRHFLVYKPLGYYCDLLEKKGFFRISRFDLINIKHINFVFKKETVVLNNNEKLTVSKRNKAKLVSLIKKLSS